MESNIRTLMSSTSTLFDWHVSECTCKDSKLWTFMCDQVNWLERVEKLNTWRKGGVERQNTCWGLSVIRKHTCTSSVQINTSWFGPNWRPYEENAPKCTSVSSILTPTATETELCQNVIKAPNVRTRTSVSSRLGQFFAGCDCARCDKQKLELDSDTTCS